MSSYLFSYVNTARPSGQELSIGVANQLEILVSILVFLCPELLWFLIVLHCGRYLVVMPRRQVQQM